MMCIAKVSSNCVRKNCTRIDDAFKTLQIGPLRVESFQISNLAVQTA